MTMLAGTGPGWMMVALGDVRVALPIEMVGEVLPVPPLSPVPMAPAWVAGIASVRGEVVPVVDAGRRLLARPSSRTGRLVLATVDETGERVGLLVDGIAGLIERQGARVEQGSGAGGKGAAASEGATGDAGVLAARFGGARVAAGAGAALPVLDLAALLDPNVESAA